MRKGLKPLQPELDRIAALSDKKELTDLLAHYQMINVSAFFNYGEQQDFKDARKQIAVVDQGGLGLPERDYYFRTGDEAEKTRKEYVEHVAKMLQLMGEPADKAASDAQKIMTLETALAKVSMDVTSRRDPENIYHLDAGGEADRTDAGDRLAKALCRHRRARDRGSECDESRLLQRACRPSSNPPISTPSRPICAGS